MSKSEAGKGDNPRPVNIKQYRNNYDKIDWGVKMFYVINDKFSEYHGCMVQTKYQTSDKRFACTGKREGVAFSTFCNESQLTLVRDWIPNE